MKVPLEAVEPSPVHLATVEAAVVTAAWADYHEEIFAFLVRTLRDPDAAEDLLQDAYVRLSRQVHREGSPDNPRAWLYRVAGNLAVSRARRASSRLRGLLRLGGRSRGSVDDAPEAGVIEREARAELVALLTALSPEARAAILLSSEGFSGAEIASAVGKSETATRTLLCRTRVRLRRALESPEALP